MFKPQLNRAIGCAGLFLVGVGLILWGQQENPTDGAIQPTFFLNETETATEGQIDRFVQQASHEQAVGIVKSQPTQVADPKILDDFSPIPNNTHQHLEPLQLSNEDRLVLENLPPICTSDLPGLDLQSQNQAVVLAAIESALSDPAEAAVSKQSDSVIQVQHVYPLFDHSPQHPVHHAIDAAFDKVAEPGRQFANSQVDSIAMANHPRSSDSMIPGRETDLRVAFNPHAAASSSAPKPVADPNAPDPHFEIFSRDAYPSATECAACHQQIYDQWASSSHAYASISPMFHAFEDTINKLSQGTIGYFCMRCHAPVATTMGLRRDQAIWDGPKVFREGVTCVACHRVKTIYTKSNGERRMEPGDIYSPVYGYSEGTGGELARKYANFYNIKTDPKDSSPGQPMHRQAIQFEEIRESTFCMSCHQVAVPPGIKLEVVWDQYRASPAYKQGISCQDCHMGKVPGVDAGYSVGPAAVVDGKAVLPERRHSNHAFYGPGYSIAHPGVFPMDPAADRWTFNQWLEFDWRAGWGTDEFEDAVARGVVQVWFPEVWANADDRYDAREIVDKNLQKLNYKDDLRRQILENGSKLDGPFFTRAPKVNKNLNFYYCLTNLNSGHNMPSGSLGAQPQIWMNVVLIDPDGNRIWETGYLDCNGDLADRHSLEVAAGRIPYDGQLMNLQTRFLTTNVKGTDREMYLPINFDIDQLPFIRPVPQPTTVLNHPPFIRMEGHSLPPLGSRNVKYSVPRKLIQQPGTYRLSVRMRSRLQPIYFMKFCNATEEMIRRMNEGIGDFHVQSVIFEVH